MKLRDFVVAVVMLNLFLGAVLLGAIGGFTGGILLSEKMRSKIVQTCTLPAMLVSYKESGTEECDAVSIEKVLTQARMVLANTDFLREIKPEMEDTKKIIVEIIAKNEDFYRKE